MFDGLLSGPLEAHHVRRLDSPGLPSSPRALVLVAVGLGFGGNIRRQWSLTDPFDVVQSAVVPLGIVHRLILSHDKAEGDVHTEPRH